MKLLTGENKAIPLQKGHSVKRHDDREMAFYRDFSAGAVMLKATPRIVRASISTLRILPMRGSVTTTELFSEDVTSVGLALAGVSVRAPLAGWVS